MSWTTRDLNELQRAFVAEHMSDGEILGVRIARSGPDPEIIVTISADADPLLLGIPKSFRDLPVRIRRAQPLVLAYALTR